MESNFDHKLHSLLETWLESEFQTHFKQLNHLIADDYRSGGSPAELFFVRRQTNETRNCDGESPPVTTTGVEEEKNSQLTNWMNNRRNKGSSLTESFTKQVKRRSDSLVNDLARMSKIRYLKNLRYLNSTPPPLKRLPPVIDNPVPAKSSIHSKRLEFLERKLLSQECSAREGQSEELICLVLTKPNDRIKRETVVYTFPDSSVDEENSKFPAVDRLFKLGGMFVTLNEVMQLFSSSQSEVFQTCVVNVSTGKQQTTLVVSTVFESNVDDSNPPILLMIAMPFRPNQSINTDSLVHLVRNCLHLKYGSMLNAFGGFFQSQSRRPFRFLDRLLITLSTMLSPQMPLPLFELSNTFFISKPQANTLVLQQLSTDESTAINLCNFLNDYNSLDWLDESIHFYKDGNDIERALSEHFARCLQFNNDNQQQQQQQPVSLDEALFFENNYPFNLLEVELSSFAIQGSCLFYRGMFLQSHLSAFYLESIRAFLFSRGLLTATKHRPYELVYFAPHYPIGEERRKSPNSAQFLLVIGYGHLLHCSLVLVYRIDRSQVFKTKTPMANTLPSSFAFYVFIKESYRLLCLYLERFEFLQQLDEFYSLGKSLSNNQLTSATDSPLKKRQSSFVRKKFDAFRNLIQAKTSQPNRKYQLGQFFRTSFLTIIYFFLPGDKSDTSGSKEDVDRSSCSYVDDGYEVKLRRSSRLSVSENASLYSFTADSSLDTVSLFDSLYYNHNSIFRFCHEYLPESLICYLNIESAQQFETFHGPIIDQLAEDVDRQTALLSSITLTLFESMQKMRQTLNSLAKIGIKRNGRIFEKILAGKSNCDANKCRKMSPRKCGRIMKQYFDLDGNPVTENGDYSSCFTFYLLGYCSIITNPETGHCLVGDEFYACFKLNPTLPSTGSMRTKQSNRLSLPVSFQLPTLTTDSGSYRIKQPNKRSLAYETDRLDFLLLDLDELVQVVRMSNWR